MSLIGHSDHATVQAGERERARELFADVPIFELGWQPREVIGSRALALAAADLCGKRNRAQSFVEGPPLRFGDGRAGTTLEMALRQTDARTIDLKRREDDLIVTAAGWRRQLPLPQALRGRVIISTRLRGGVMRITFAPPGRKEAS